MLKNIRMLPSYSGTRFWADGSRLRGWRSRIVPTNWHLGPDRIPPPPGHALHVFSAGRIPIPHPIFLRLYFCPESVVPEEAEPRRGRRACGLRRRDSAHKMETRSSPDSEARGSWRSELRGCAARSASRSQTHSSATGSAAGESGGLVSGGLGFYIEQTWVWE
jgi:hypothetical protein